LVYPAFFEAAEAARRLGFRVNLITNGLRLNPTCLDRLEPMISLIGVSLDGTRELHDRMRGPGTFDRTVRRIERLRTRGLRFGIAHCVTRSSIPELPRLLELSSSLGAQLLQLHPLTLNGRAATDCRTEALTGSDLARVFLIAELFRIQVGESLHVQLDVASTQQALEGRRRYRVLEVSAARGESLSDLVNPLIVDERGQLWPLAYGMAQSQRIASADSSWKEQVAAYVGKRGEPLRALIEETLTLLATQPSGFVDWYGLLVEESRRRELSKRPRGSVVLPLVRQPV
jgi:hypothetical protein